MANQALVEPIKELGHGARDQAELWETKYGVISLGIVMGMVVLGAGSVRHQRKSDKSSIRIRRALPVYRLTQPVVPASARLC